MIVLIQSTLRKLNKMYVFIINPVAGNGRAKKIHSRLKKLAEYKKMAPICYFTKYKGHAEKIARQINSDPSVKTIVVIGGDGTMHEVVNGIKNKEILLAFIPGGSGNDFARGASMSFSPKEVFKTINENKGNVDYWLGMYKTKDNDERNFINCIGFGFDAVVTKSANNSQFKRLFNKFRLGKIGYTIAIIHELLLYKPITIIVETDDLTKKYANCFLITINNHAYFGGGMKINPQAKNNQDDLSVLIIDSISKWKVLALFLTVFTGKHIHFKEVNIISTKQIKISAEKPIPFQTDGETGETVSCFIKKAPLPLKIKGTSSILK